MTGRLPLASTGAAVLAGLLLSCAVSAAAALPNRAARALQQTSAVAEAPAAAVPAQTMTSPTAAAPAAAPGPAAEAALPSISTLLLTLALCPGGLLDGGQPAPFLGPLRHVEAAGVRWGYHTFGPTGGAARAPPVLLLPGTVRRVGGRCSRCFSQAAAGQEQVERQLHLPLRHHTGGSTWCPRMHVSSPSLIKLAILPSLALAPLPPSPRAVQCTCGLPSCLPAWLPAGK